MNECLGTLQNFRNVCCDSCDRAKTNNFANIVNAGFDFSVLLGVHTINIFFLLNQRHYDHIKRNNEKQLTHRKRDRRNQWQW